MAGSAVVVGAGVGGLCTAIGLGQAGWRVTVLERWPSVTGIGAGIGVWPDAQDALDRLGVGDAFRERAVDFGRSSLFTASGRRLCAVPSRRIERRGGAPIRILPRAELIDLLVTAASRHAEIDTGVDVAAKPHLLDDADLVVGADGLRSTVRGVAFARERSAPAATGFVAWRGQVDSEFDDAAYGETWGDGMLCGLTRLGPGRSNVYIAADERLASFDDVRARLRAWRDPIPAVLASMSSDAVLRHPIEDIRPHLSTFVTDRVALIGDAAHAMTPNLGRGACEAIVDAASLAAAVADEADDVSLALRRYDGQRRRATQRVVVRSRRALRTATTGHPVVRDAVLRLLSPLIR